MKFSWGWGEACPLLQPLSAWVPPPDWGSRGQDLPREGPRAQVRGFARAAGEPPAETRSAGARGPMAPPRGLSTNFSLEASRVVDTFLPAGVGGPTLRPHLPTALPGGGAFSAGGVCTCEATTRGRKA